MASVGDSLPASNHIISSGLSGESSMIPANATISLISGVTASPLALPVQLAGLASESIRYVVVVDIWQQWFV